MKWFIYLLEDPRTREVRYVGKTEQRAVRQANPARRLVQHLSDARRGVRRHVYDWLRSVLHDGLQPVLHVVQTGTGDGAGDAELLWISIARTLGVRLTNLTDGGDGPTGLKHSPESLSKLSDSLRAANADPATIARRSSAMKAVWQDPQRRARQSNTRRGQAPWNKGKTASEATRSALSRAHTGLKQTPETVAARVAKTRGRPALQSSGHVSRPARPQVGHEKRA